MKTKKLWIWSIAFGFCATVIFYLVLNSDEKTAVTTTVAKTEETNKTIEVEASVEASNQSTVTSEKSHNDNKGVKEEKNPSINEILPISKGKRAMSIQVADVQGAAGFIKPGSHVDVVAKLIVPEEAKEGQHNAATIILQNVKILALGHAADDAETRKRYQMVTLEVSSKEGLALGLATKYELYLMLRADGDIKKDSFHTHIHEDELHKGVFLK
jgi:pilus assembly protein CpaB